MPDFKNKRDEIAFLVKNKERLIAQKKSATKWTDNNIYRTSILSKGGELIKENEAFIPDGDSFKVRVIINTTKLFDSHRDVHLNGLWKKSLKENKGIMHVRQHRSNDFEFIISDDEDLKAFTKMFTWDELGAPEFKGNTEALTFDSTVRRKRNEFMFDQYSNGWVKQHSVGMIYMKLILGVNDDNFGAEFEAWEKYSPEIVNLSDAEDVGHAWFVKEAKVIEGSAVPRGSNWITPTQDNNFKNEPDQSTQVEIEPSTEDTQKRKYFNSLLKN
ncbi:hypothetical protein KAR91_70835 [Candidatus Pacearchaeota archaeon]|nr:hypothetical protein [Candidatus Pacearchaeota archaeon]